MFISPKRVADGTRPSLSVGSRHVVRVDNMRYTIRHMILVFLQVPAVPPAHGPAEEERPGVPLGALRVSQGVHLGAFRVLA